MFSKVALATAVQAVLLDKHTHHVKPAVKAHGQKAHHAAKWHQEIDDEWTSHPNFPNGPYGHAHENAQVSKPGKKLVKKHQKKQ